MNKFPTSWPYWTDLKTQNLSTHILYLQEKKKLTSGCKVHHIFLSINKEMVLARLNKLLKMGQQFSEKFQ